MLASSAAPRDASIKRGLSRHAVSVRVSVCSSRSYILSKRILLFTKLSVFGEIDLRRGADYL